MSNGPNRTVAAARNRSMAQIRATATPINDRDAAHAVAAEWRTELGAGHVVRVSRYRLGRFYMYTVRAYRK